MKFLKLSSATQKFLEKIVEIKKLSNLNFLPYLMILKIIHLETESLENIFASSAFCNFVVADKENFIRDLKLFLSVVNKTS